MSQSSSVATELDIVERLRHNHEMLKDGHQNNLTELWHSETVKDAAADALEAALEIERLRGLIVQGVKTMDELELNREMQEKSVAQAIWRAHKDNYNLRMHEVYPLMARAAIEAMREHIRSLQETAHE